MKSLCRTCGLEFTTANNFDRHRVGKYDIAAPRYGRRCLTADEMFGSGWRRNIHGRLTRNLPRDVLRTGLESTISSGTIRSADGLEP